jgi:predicted peptidase
VWAFHGEHDTAVKTKRSRDMIAALKQAGGQPRYTEYHGVGHNSWTATYANRDVYAWLFAQRRTP